MSTPLGIGEDKPANPYAMGPMLRASGRNPKTNGWGFSAMIATVNGQEAPAIQLVEEAKKVVQLVQAREIYRKEYEENVFVFHKYHFEVKQGEEAKKVVLIVDPGNLKLTLPVEIPGTNTLQRFAYFSCNGFHDLAKKEKYGGIQPMWRDLNEEHSKKPMHGVMGGGDQIYNDPVIVAVRSIQKWRAKTEAERIKHPFTKKMEEELDDFYFNAYIEQWKESGFREGMASMPTIFSRDDHDTVDGAYSLRDVENNCPVIQGIYSVARKYDLLFQHQATEAILPEMNFFGKKGYHYILEFGATAVLNFDARNERSHDRIAHPESYPMIYERLLELSPSVKQIIVMMSVPFIYPPLDCILKGLELVDKINPIRKLRELLKLKHSDAEMRRITDRIDEEDDMRDHPNHPDHMAERLLFLELLMDVAIKLGKRVIVVSGDVHCASQGKIYSTQEIDPEHDPRYIPQLTSSAIGNEPPPKALIVAMHHEVSRVETINRLASATLTHWFSDADKSEERFVRRRNYMILEETPNGMRAILKAEDPEKSPDRKTITVTKVYTMEIPHLTVIAKPHTTGLPKSGGPLERESEDPEALESFHESGEDKLKNPEESEESIDLGSQESEGPETEEPVGQGSGEQTKDKPCCEII